MKHRVDHCKHLNILLVGDGEFHVEVGKSKLNQLVFVSHERV